MQGVGRIDYGNWPFSTIFGQFVPKMVKIESKRRILKGLRRCDEIVDYSMDILRILPQQQAKKIKVNLFSSRRCKV